MPTDLERFLLAALFFAALGFYAFYTHRRVVRIVDRTRRKASIRTRADAAALARLYGAVSPPEHSSLYRDLANKIEEMPIE